MSEPAQEQRKPSRKERELQFRLNLVMDAAEEVFAETTFARASVEDIAEKAEISVGTLYNLFRSKEDIYRAVVSRAQEGYFDRVEERLDEARGPLDKVHAVVSYSFEHFHRYARHFRLYVSATNGFQWELRSKLDAEAIARQTQFRTRLTDICQDGLDQGIFKRGVPAEVLAINVANIPHPFLLVWLERETVDLMGLLPHALTLVDRILGVDVD
ncbi:MAG: TetR/AcrR family transcriptional regulator [Deltaproteobacteria bacterium]|nr:TetR/AcrR family transcriptional regulator [Deltaproteobacteria bacterium]